jgi:peroxiredoxin
VPGFVEAHDELRAKGIDQVFVVSTTDGELRGQGREARVACISEGFDYASSLQSKSPIEPKTIDRIYTKKELIRSFSTHTAYVMDAFMQSLGPIASGRVAMLADGNHELAKALGLTFDASARGMGTRVQRFAMVVAGDGVVNDVQVDAAGAIKTTRAGHLMARL